MATLKEIRVPDIGDFSDVEIIELLVRPGETVIKEDSLITLESDKASMEIPSPENGIVRELMVSVGDRVSKGDLILSMDLTGAMPSVQESGTGKASVVDSDKPVSSATQSSARIEMQTLEPAPSGASAEKPPPDKLPSSNEIGTAAPSSAPPVVPTRDAGRSSPTAHLKKESINTAHASPAVRRFARELGVELGEIKGSGPKRRILKTDIQAYVKRSMSAGRSGFNVAEIPEVDFSKYGEIEVQPLTRINKLTGQHLHRNWVRIPHVTQFDEADITELEEFRTSLNQEYGAKEVKITILTFLMKAVVSALKKYPRFNTSVDVEQENLIYRRYYHIGVAVETAQGLVVPVIREVDRKSIVEIARELSEVSDRARKGNLSPAEIQGGCLTISSLGGVGGSAFTPIINAPQVAVLGVSRAAMKPVYQQDEFTPRLILPLSLSYDHRVIDGADGARFTSFVSAVLSDTRRMLL